MAGRNVLVIGSGGREYALCVALERSASVGRIHVAPGSAAFGVRWACGDIRPTDLEALLAFIEINHIELVIIGPEAPLVDGLADVLTAKGVAVFGPSAYAARLEGSKVFTKKFAQELGIPTAAFQVFTNPSAARAYVSKLTQLPVIKADGLCAGKGVVVADDVQGALRAIDAILERRAFGDAGAAIVIEEKLEGEELSVQVMSDGERYILLPAAQDHKRVGDGNTGENTGGMGAYAPAPILTPELEKQIRTKIIEPSLKGMRDRGHPFRGVLFAGLMISPAGEPYLLEFNVRFGDPEAQVVLPLLEGDFGKACYQCATGKLNGDELKIRNKHAICVVLASQGYPGNVRTGDIITGLDEITNTDDLMVIHAGTRRIGADYTTASGRVLNVVAVSNSLKAASELAYATAKKIRFDGLHYRRDIGARALQHV